MPSPPLIHSFKNLFDANDLPWTLPLPPLSSPRDRQVRGIRRVARTVLRRKAVAERGWSRTLTAAAAWPALSLLKAILASRGEMRLHRSRILSVLDAWWLQLAHNIRLADLEYFRFDRPGRRARTRRFVTDAENKALLEFLNRSLPSQSIGDKRPFAEFCLRHGLPAAPVLAIGAGGGAQPEFLNPWPPADLFLKAATLWGGHGACILSFNQERRTWSCDGHDNITRDTLADFVRARLHNAPWVLQPRLFNGPDWAGFSPPGGALATVRVTTARQLPSGPIAILGGVMRCPRRGSPVDNLCSGGIGTDYEPETGRLGAFRSMTPGPLLSHHPDTGARLEGTLIPHWPEIVALARRAHEPVTDIATIGWDISLCMAGPILIEANPNWGVLLDTPLGDTPYVEYILQPAVSAGFPN